VAEAGRVTTAISEISTPASLPVATVNRVGVYIDPRGVKRRELGEHHPHDGNLPPLTPTEFRQELRRLVSEYAVDGRRNRSAG
jgi:hypothetical protein